MKRTRVARGLTGMTALAVATVSSVAAVSSAGAAPTATVTEKSPGVVKTFEKHPFYTHEWGLDHPSGATYADGPGVLAIAERQGDGSVVALLRPERESLVARMTVAGLTDPDTLADNGHGTLAALDGQTLLTWSAAARGAATVKRQKVQGVSLRDAAGMTYDPSTQRWLVLDAARQRIVVLDKQGSTVQASDGVSLAGLGASRLQGIALDSSSGRTYVADAASSRLYAVAADGTQEQVLDVSELDTRSLGSLAFGPTADPTDSAKLSSLYTTQSGDTSTFGQVSEMSLQPLSATATIAATSSTGSLVRKSLLSQLSPPSPDPSGIVYMTDSQRLFVADSEVDEMSIYAGVNMWQISRDSSTLYDTGNTLKFSKEPTGIAYDPQGKRLFISDDDKAKVFQLSAGGDNRFGTSDDPVSSISATAFGDDDAEDVAYDTVSGDLFVSQGVGSEVYRVSPGANGRFDGIPPTGDDTVSHFDVEVYGITDGESLGYSPTRDSLFMSDPTAGKIIEVTKDGALVQTIDVSGLGMKNPADITLAPATDDPTRTDLYVVTRGIDNDKHPDENDGTMYEISAPNLGPTTPQVNTAPTVSAGTDSTVTLPASALLHGTVTDDGLPNPPGFTTSSWSMVGGPGAVTFGDASSLNTTASFTAAGTYVLRLTATDGALTTGDDVTVVVNPQSATNTAPSVFAGNDQTVTLPGSASLSGTASDDGLPNPPASTTVAWSQVSGPGSVTFSAPSSTSTLASFSIDGTYVLRLTADDSALTGTDDVTVVVRPAPSSGNLVKNPGFEVDTTGWKGSTGTTLTRVTSPHSGSWSGQLANTSTASTRCTLNDSPNWIPTTEPATYTMSAWVKGDAAGVGSTARLVANEYVGTTVVGSKEVSVTLTTGWQKLELSYVPASPGSSWLDYNVVRPSTPAGAVCFLADDLFAGTGGSSAATTNLAPMVSAGADASALQPAPVSLDGTVTDDGEPNPPGAVTSTWSTTSGPGTVTFADQTAVDTTASFSAAGSYVLRLTANDSALTSSDEVTVTMQPATSTGVALQGADSQTANGAATVGKAENGDTITFTYNEAVNLGTVTPGWSGAAVAVSVRLRDGGLLSLGAKDDTLDVSRGGSAVNLGAVNLREDYIKGGKTAVFNASMTAATTTVGGVVATTVALRLGTLASGDGIRTVSNASNVVWTPSAAVTDPGGEACSTTKVTESGALDREF